MRENIQFPKRQIFDSSKLKAFADDNFRFDENGRKFSKWLENSVEKGEIACNEQFLLFPQCFQKTCYADTKRLGLVWERVNSQRLCRLALHQTTRYSITCIQKPTKGSN